MVTLYKYKGQVDLILTDPPYNTGKDFRYNDKWDTDPNDPDLGNIVSLEDGSRHTKWMKFMLPRLQVMKGMLKPEGILAICIDEREFFHLGMLLNETFGEENRIAIINWQKTYSPKNDTKHVSTATEYVLIYAKDKERAKTRLLPRNETMNKRFSNPDNDPDGVWSGKDPTAKEIRKNASYAIQSPFTGHLHYPEAEFTFSGDVPPAKKHWTGLKKSEMKSLLESWGVKYTETDIKDGRGKALIISGAKVTLSNYDAANDPAVIRAKREAQKRLKQDNWSKLIFLGSNNEGRPRIKNHLIYVKQGKVPLTYWASEDYDDPDFFDFGVQSWAYTESGHSQTGLTELNAILGSNHGFETVKPLRLFEKIIQIWCPSDGIVLDPFAGSGTTAHAVLKLNNATDTCRKFILVEKGEGTDEYAKTLTRERVKRAITGERMSSDSNDVSVEPLDGAFVYWELDAKIDASAILAMRREELIDVIITSHWEDDRYRATSVIERFPERYKHLVGKTGLNEGFFIIWNGDDDVGHLDQSIYMELLEEAKKEGVKTPYHVYARYQVYQTSKVRFYQIPDKILMHLGLNENSDRFNNEETE